MAYKTIRNRALAEEWRLITGTTDDGKHWYTPDGHFAVLYPIYDGYKVKKSQLVEERQPDMTVIFNEIKGNTYTDAIVSGTGITERGVEYYKIEGMGKVEWVNRLYANLLNELYPTAQTRINLSRNLAPIEYMVDGEIVGVIMPMKKDK